MYRHAEVSSNVVEKCFEITAIGVHADELSEERHRVGCQLKSSLGLGVKARVG